jgi:hypothetical protein
MTDDTTLTPGGDLDEQSPPVDQPPPEEPDWFLAGLVAFSERFSISPEITLFVGGTVITGALSTGRAYFEELGRQMAASNLRFTGGDDEQLVNSLRETLADWCGQWAEAYPKPQAEQEAPATYAYIHLKDARILAGQQWSHVGLWRGKLSAVDGYTIGNLS